LLCQKAGLLYDSPAELKTGDSVTALNDCRATCLGEL
jgi:hypothetical protein